MKKLLVGTVGLIALAIAAPASAADLAARPYTKAPPPMMAPLYDWSGFYIGANGGFGWGPPMAAITAGHWLRAGVCGGGKDKGGGQFGGRNRVLGGAGLSGVVLGA